MGLRKKIRTVIASDSIPDLRVVLSKINKLVTAPKVPKTSKNLIELALVGTAEKVSGVRLSAPDTVTNAHVDQLIEALVHFKTDMIAKNNPDQCNCVFCRTERTIAAAKQNKGNK